VEDVSGNGNTGYLKGTMATATSTAVASGKIGQGLDFNGSDDYVFVNDSASISFGAGSSFSVQAWVKMDDCQANGSKIVEKKQLNNESYNLSCQSTGKPIFSVRDSVLTNGDVVGTTVLTDGNWHHMVGVKTGNNLELFVDGISEGTASPSYTGNWNDGDLRIGTSIDGGARNTDGKVDDVRVYNRALSTTEIQRLYNMGR